MLTYRAQNDINHGCYRQMKILKRIDGPIEIDKLFIIDFYLLYPHMLRDFTVPSNFRALKNRCSKIDNTYSAIDNVWREFNDLNIIQKEVLYKLLSYNLITVNESWVSSSNNDLDFSYDLIESNIIDMMSNLNLNGDKSIAERSKIFKK